MSTAYRYLHSLGRFVRFLHSWIRDDPARFVVVTSGKLPVRIAGSAARLLTVTGLGNLLPTTWYLLSVRAGLQPPPTERLVARCTTRARCRLAAVLAALELPERALAALPPGDRSSLRARTTRAEVLLRSGEITAAAAQLRATDQGRRAHRVSNRCMGEFGVLQPSPVRPPRTRRAVLWQPVESIAGRVLHVVTNALPYVRAGYTFRTQQIAKAQAASGLEPHVVTSWGWPELQGVFGAAPFAQVEGIPHHRLLPHGRIPARADHRIERGVSGLADLVEQLRPAVLHAATNHRNGTVAAAVSELTGLPMVYEVRGFLEDTWAFRNGEPASTSERYRLERARETAIMRGSDAVVTLSETMRAELLSRGVHADRIHLAPNAVPSALLRSRPDGRSLRRRFGIEDGTPVIGAVSTVNEYEGFDTLLDAVAVLREARHRVYVLIAGDGPHLPRLRSRVRELRLDKQVRLTGRLTSDEALLAQAALDLFVAPRRNARMCRLVAPLKAVEAMALGVPLIVSDLPALTELSLDTGSGVCVPPDDRYGLAKTVLELLEDPDRRIRLGAAGRQAVAERHTWERVTKTYQDLYRQITDIPHSLP